MKKTLLLSLLLFIAILMNGQESLKQKELGLTFRDLNSFGFTYRCGTATSLWRYNTLLISGRAEKESRDSSDIINNNFNSTFSFGKEYLCRIR